MNNNQYELQFKKEGAVTKNISIFKNTNHI